MARTLKIRIVNAPEGIQPDEVREAWRGLELPLAAGYPQPGNAAVIVEGHFLNRTVKTYVVYAQDAFAILAQKAPETLEWWKQNAADFFDPKRIILFDVNVCQRI
jgi:hypothetical protein